VANRDTFSAEFRSELQTELDRLNSGQEILAVIVEAIHPPPGAANAYHAVQAAEISSKVSVANETGAAEKNKKEAQEEATRMQDQAIAASAEALSGAEAEQQLFEGDHSAYMHGGKAFLLERWFDRARTALARAHIVVMDHRLSGAAAPTIDLREFAPAH
jgi:regulator of protease activity HflC (stomatin/prohibitin superfamily)